MVPARPVHPKRSDLHGEITKKSFHTVRTAHTRTLFWMYENCLNVWKLISKLFWRSSFWSKTSLFGAEIPLLRTSVTRLKDKSADVLVCPRQHLLFCSEILVPDTWSVWRLMNVPVNGARGPEGVGLSKPKRAVKPRRWQQLLLGALRLVYEPRWRLGREPAERSSSRLGRFLWSGPPAADSCYPVDCSLAVGGCKCECKCDQCEYRWPPLLKRSTLGGCVWVASHLCCFLMNAGLLFSVCALKVFMNSCYSAGVGLSADVPRSRSERGGFSRMPADRQKPAALTCDSGMTPLPAWITQYFPSASDSWLNIFESGPSAAVSRLQLVRTSAPRTLGALG